jgi:hypothetical protein
MEFSDLKPGSYKFSQIRRIETASIVVKLEVKKFIDVFLPQRYSALSDEDIQKLNNITGTIISKRDLHILLESLLAGVLPPVLQHAT